MEGVPRRVVQGRVVLPGTPPTYHPRLVCCLHPDLRGPCGKRVSWAQRASWAWVRASLEEALPRVVTVLRAFATGRIARERTESGNVWIAGGQAEPYTGLGSINPEEARKLT